MARQESGERAPAPGALGLLQGFVNTNDLNTGRDLLAGPGLLAGWATANGLLRRDVEVTEEDWLLAVALREGLRELLSANSGARVGLRSVQGFNDCARRVGLQTVAGRDGGLRLEPVREGGHQALGQLLSIAVMAQLDGTWARLKVCRQEHCRWAFYDRSKNRSAAWCTMAACGSRAKARAYRRRQRVLAAPG